VVTRPPRASILIFKSASLGSLKKRLP
jgi:hypothetical protein